jgi:hypothetical protein
MALNTDFKVKDSLYVGNSACFVNQTNTASILSAGVSLLDIFLQQGEISAQCALINGTGITGLNYDGQSICTISISAVCDNAWNTAYNWVSGNGTTVTNTLTTLRSLSGANITSVTSPSQGTLTTTTAGGTPITIDTWLQPGDSPTFAGVTAGNITVGTITDSTISTISGDLVIKSTSGTITLSGDAHIGGDLKLGALGSGTSNTVLISAADGIIKSDVIDSRVWGAQLVSVDGAGGTATKIPVFNSGSGGYSLGDSIITQNTGGNTITIAGCTSITGNLSVLGDLTCINTLMQVTSAVSIINHGTGPALYAEQTGVSQPIARFVDTEGGHVVIGDSGKVGIGIADNVPDVELTVSGSISASDDLTIRGSSVIFSALPAGTSNTVLLSTAGGVVATDGIDSKVWACNLVDYTATSNNYVPKFSNTTGTIGNSNITDSGTLISLNSDVTIGNGATIKQPSATGGVYTLDQVFVGTVGTTATSVATFAKSGLNSVKYEVTLKNGVNITTFEVHAVYNGTDPFGTVYAIVDAQAASQLVTVDISSSGSTIDLNITAATAVTTATIYGKAKY